MQRVVCVGSLNVDTQVYVERFCENDEEQIIRDMSVGSGGQAGNIAAGLGKLGKKSFFFGNIGEDAYTSMLTKDFDDCNVDYSFAKRTKNPNNAVVSLIDKDGERRLYACNHVDLSQADFPDKLFENTAFIVFTSLIKEDVIELYVDIAKKAKEKGIKIALDPGGILAQLGFERLRPLLELTDYFFPSKREAELLVGGIGNIAKICKLILNVIISCGKEGPRVFEDGEEITNFEVKQAKKRVDTTGAGDCFAAAYISAIIDGKNNAEAACFANCAAALSIEKKGARSMPTQKEAEEFMNAR
ncbi:carbohydrate kinase family protein [Candidatus Woesearchaeota archaeon]|nr:carbohydrate kinase family protein [Candidatus Woesearchaeota archaeon]